MAKAAKKYKPKKSRLTLSDLKARVAAAWADMDRCRPDVQDCYRYALPQRSITADGWEADRHARDFIAYDDTAIASTNRFASRMMSAATPTFQEWFEIRPADGGQPDPALEKLTKTVQQVLWKGPVLAAFYEMYLDLAAGRGCLLIQPGDDVNPVIFTAVPRLSVAVQEGAHGRIDFWARKMKIQARDIARQWPDAKLPKSVQDLVSETGEKADIKLHEVTCFCEHSGRFEYRVWVEGGADEDGFMVERSSLRSPWVTPRWSKVPGQNDGFGPLQNALPSIRTVNKIVEMTLQAAALTLNGLYTVADDGVVDVAKLRITPGSFIPVARNGGPMGKSIEPLTTNVDPNLSILSLEEYRAGIRRMLLDTGLPDNTDPVKSATEIHARVQELNAEAGAGFGRLVDEGLTPAVQRVIEILSEKGRIEFPADMELDGFLRTVRVTSQLAQVQRMEQLQRVTQWMGIIGQFLGPEVMALGVKVEDFPALAADALDVPADYVRPAEQREQIQQLVAQMVAGQAAQGATPPEEGAPV